MNSLDELLGQIQKSKKTAKPRLSQPAVSARKSFVRASGPGGVVFDFGPVTGNPIADHTNALFRTMSDPVQVAQAQANTVAYQKALNSFVQLGEAKYSSMAQEAPAAPQEQKYFEAETSTKTVDSSNFHKSQISVGSELVQATSETDAALIEMMKADGMTF